MIELGGQRIHLLVGNWYTSNDNEIRVVLHV